MSNFAFCSPTVFSATTVYRPSSSLVTFFKVKVVLVSWMSMFTLPADLIGLSSLLQVTFGVGIPRTLTGIFRVDPAVRVIRSRNLLSNSRMGGAE